jgi:hypothetical protein
VCLAQASTARSIQAFALTHLGHVLVDLGRLIEAANAYQEAFALRRQLGEHHEANEPLAGLARVATAQGDLRQAQVYVEEILRHLEIGTLEGTIEPFRIYLTCYHVLQANGDSRACGILEDSHGLLQEQAAKISDEGDRRSFLENVAAHREIVTEHAEAGTRPALRAG